MRRLTLLFVTVVLSLTMSTSAFSYEIQTIADIALADKISGIGYQASGLVAISRETKSLYVIDTSSNAITREIHLDIVPSGVAIDSRNNSAIVSSQDGTLHFIDLETGNIVKTISIASHSHFINAITLNQTGNLLCIGTDDRLMLMDLKTESFIKETLLSDVVTGMDIDSSSNSLLITMKGKEGLYVYDGDTLNSIIGIKTGEIPSGVSINPSTHTAVLTNYSDNSISIISLENRTVLDTIPFNEQPGAVAIDSVSNSAFVANKDGIAIIKLENPVPIINRLIPNSARSGDSGLMLSIEGDKFIKDSQTQFNKKDVPTYFQTSESLQAHVSPEDLTTSGNVPVTVTNPQPGGGMSNALEFSIFDPAPVLDSITPDTIALPLSAGTLSMRVRGKNFFNGSIINLNGENLKTRFISSILLEADITPSLIKSPNQYPVVVINPWPGAYTSNSVFLNVVTDNSFSGIVDRASRSASSQLPVFSTSQLPGTGSLTGWILNEHKQPLEGITIRTKNLSAQTDAKGYFRLDNVPAGNRHVMIRGETAKEAGAHYPTIPLTIDIQSGVTNEMPFQVYLHKQKHRNYKNINPNEDTILTDPEVPGFELRIPKGIKITGWDGKPNKKVSVRTVAIDRLPVKPLPPNADVRTVYMFHFDKVGGGIPDQPIPVKAKNDLGLLPGEKAILWYYDESPNEGEAPNDWAIAGTGTVTPDGKYISSDPGVGMPKFCCGAGGFGGPGGGPGPPPPPPPCPGGGGGGGL